MFRQIFKKVFIVLIATVITSCADMQSNYSDTISSWRGSHVNTLLQHWGKPDRKLTTLTGSTVYVYKKQERKAVPEARTQVGVHNSGGRPVIITEHANKWGEGVTIFCITAFEVNKEGIIVDTQSQGNNCYADSTFIQTMGNPKRN